MFKSIICLHLLWYSFVRLLICGVEGGGRILGHCGAGLQEVISGAWGDPVYPISALHHPHHLSFIMIYSYTQENVDDIITLPALCQILNSDLLQGQKSCSAVCTVLTNRIATRRTCISSSVLRKVCTGWDLNQTQQLASFKHGTERA